MSNDALNFCENIISNSEYNEQYLLLANAENNLKISNHNYDNINDKISFLIKNEYIVRQILQYMKNYISVRLKFLNIDKFIIFYNHTQYKLRINFNLVEKNDSIEESFKLCKNSHKIELKCLLKFKNMLKKEEKIESITNMYLYFVTLSLISKNINTYFEQQLTLNDGEFKNFFVNFANEIDIQKNIEDLDKVKKLILEM